MFGLGFSEILVIAVIAIVFIGPDQLPDLARTIGRFINDLKRSTDSLKDDFRNQIQIDFEERKKEIFTDVHHHAPEAIVPPDSLIAPHETDPMLSDRQLELQEIETNHDHTEQHLEQSSALTGLNDPSLNPPVNSDSAEAHDDVKVKKT